VHYTDGLRRWSGELQACGVAMTCTIISDTGQFVTLMVPLLMLAVVFACTLLFQHHSDVYSLLSLSLSSKVHKCDLHDMVSFHLQ
jgi:hypothetical protein